MQLCNGLPGRHHHLQQVRKRTFRTLRRNIHQTKSSKTQTQTRKMLLLQKTHTIPWTLNLSRRNPTPTGETREHSQNASTKKPKRSETIPRPSRLLQKIHSQICRHFFHLTKRDIEFKLTPECENCFHILKEFLQQAPILKYPDPQANYTLYTDASKYAYAGVLTQHSNGADHPITYVSALFHGSQLNWATLTKEAYAIYMSVKKLSFYIETAKITVKSDHLPIKKFLEKNTLNSKVNNWAVGTRITKHNIRVHPQDLEHFGRYLV